MTGGASLALDAIIIPNDSAVKPKAFDRRDALPATTTRIPLQSARSEIECALLDAVRRRIGRASNILGCLVGLWTARPQHYSWKKLHVECTSSAVPQF